MLQAIMIAAVAGKDEKKAIMIESKKAFIFEQKVDKTEAYVGEPIVLTYTFKQRRDVDLTEANFNASSFENFWAKTTKKVPNRVEGEYNVYTIHYLLYAQKSGDLTIESGRMDVGILSSQKKDFFNFQQASWKTFYSNKTDIHVKPLPEGVSLYGDYTFTVVADKNVTKANEPVNLTITIRGEGNVDDIDDFVVDVPHATVYADKSKKSFDLNHGKNTILFKQKFAIVSDRNFTIPSLAFTFFNGEVKELHSRAFKIEVKNSRQKQTLAKLEKKIVQPRSKIVREEASKLPIMIAVTLSFLMGIIATVLFNLWKNREKNKYEKPIQTRIKEAKEDKVLLGLLLPYVHYSPKIQGVVKQLEENIYANASHQIERKTLAKEFEGYLKKEKREEILDV